MDSIHSCSARQKRLFSHPQSIFFLLQVWSPTRPSVLILGRMDGALDIWDFSDTSQKPSVTHAVTSAAVTSLSFQNVVTTKDGKKTEEANCQLAVGDVDGHLHILVLPKNLVKPLNKEAEGMTKFLEREEQSVEYFSSRKTALAELKEEKEKAEQSGKDAAEAAAAGGAGGEGAVKTAKEVTDEALDRAEAFYKKFEMEQKAIMEEEEKTKKREKSPKGRK